MNVYDNEKEYIKKILNKCKDAPSIYDNMNSIEKIKEGIKYRKESRNSCNFTKGSVRVRREMTPWNNN